jgi:hypothetical protein
MAKTPEKIIQNAILDYLALCPSLLVIPIDTVGMFDAKRGAYRKKKPNRGAVWHTGVADVLVYSKKHGFIALEVKSPKGRQSPVQKEFQAACEFLGVVYNVVRSIDDVLNLLQTLDKLKSSDHGR